MVWVQQLRVRDLRNIREATLELGPGLNVFVGQNGQGKTSLLEAVGLVARGRSFRTDDATSVIRRGAGSLVAAAATHDERPSELEVELEPGKRAFRVNGREVRATGVPRPAGRGRVLERAAARGPRQRCATAGSSSTGRRGRCGRRTGPSCGSSSACSTQRNAALESRARDEDAWTERFVACGARLRNRRAAYAARLTAALAEGFRPARELYEVRVCPTPAGEAGGAARRSAEELRQLAPRERAAGRSLAGPHRDAVDLLLDGQDAGESGLVRTGAQPAAGAGAREPQVLCEETGRAAVALLDDLDSELDEERAGALCAEVARRGQAWVTTAHPGWAESLRPLGRIYEVSGGAVRCA